MKKSLPPSISGKMKRQFSQDDLSLHFIKKDRARRQTSKSEGKFNISDEVLNLNLNDLGSINFELDEPGLNDMGKKIMMI